MAIQPFAPTPHRRIASTQTAHENVFVQFPKNVLKKIFSQVQYGCDSHNKYLSQLKKVCRLFLTIAHEMNFENSSINLLDRFSIHEGIFRKKEIFVPSSSYVPKPKIPHAERIVSFVREFSLKEFKLIGYKFDDSGDKVVPEVARMEDLEKLDLSCFNAPPVMRLNMIGLTSLDLFSMGRLEELDLRGCASLRKIDINRIRTLTKIDFPQSVTFLRLCETHLPSLTLEHLSLDELICDMPVSIGENSKRTLRIISISSHSENSDCDIREFKKIEQVFLWGEGSSAKDMYIPASVRVMHVGGFSELRRIHFESKSRPQYTHVFRCPKLMEDGRL